MWYVAAGEQQRACESERGKLKEAKEGRSAEARKDKKGRGEFVRRVVIRGGERSSEEESGHQRRRA
eukprot:5786724-Pleurochrysis_carterae.AAC.1